MAIATVERRETRCTSIYPQALELVRAAARAHGYAIGVHGSQKRDLDLIAAPWTEEASLPGVLIAAIAQAVGGYITDATSEGEPWPRVKPHGRLCWSIHLGGGPYLDISVLPRR
jgi:hypothetical protein